MKRIRILLLTVALFLTFLCFPSYAASEQSTGLAAFTDKASYEPGVFSDVPTGAWFEGGVKTSYRKGIMNGVGSDQFDPSGTVTWAQAVTIAARIHKTYHAFQIPDTGGIWYDKYLAYADDFGILPYTCPKSEMLGSAVITRQELAFLFRAVLDDADLPGLDGIAVPDLEEVDEGYRDAVSKMYAAGIITGKSGGVFDPAGVTTRAEIATIVGRLLCPGQRVIIDPKANQAILSQYGNFLMGGCCVATEDAVYYLVEEPSWIDGAPVSRWTIVSRTDEGDLRDVYQTGFKLHHLSLGEDGYLYVIRDGKTLVRIDPATGKDKTVFEARQAIHAYCLYDGEIYLYAVISGENTLSDAVIGKLDGDRLKTLKSDISWSDGMYVDDSFYCFGEKLYFVYSDSLWSIDLNKGTAKKVFTPKDYDVLFLHDIAYYGSTVWFYGSNARQSEWFLKQASLLMPEQVDTVCQIPENAAQLYSALYANGPDLYHQSSWGRHVWKVSSAGGFDELITLQTPYIEASAVTRQAVITPTLTSITQCVFNSFDAYLPDGSVVPYMLFLGKPWFTGGGDVLSAAEGSAERGELPEPAPGETGVRLVREYRTERGDYAAEFAVMNGMDSAMKLRLFVIEFTAGKLELNRKYLPVSGPNIADSREVPPNSSQLYTFIIPAETMVKAGASSNGHLSVDLYLQGSETPIPID